MDLLVAWVGFPLAFAALVCGWGLLVETVSGRELPGAVLPGAGFAALIVALDLPGFSSALAPAAFAIGVAGAVVGIGLHVAGVGPRTARARPGGWALVALAGAFLAYAAPTLLSGAPAVSGYVRLDDSATWTALGEYVLRHGTDLSGLPPSSHDSALAAYLPGHYPVGAFLPLAQTGRLIGTDLAWVYSSYLACVAGILALALYHLAGRLVASRAACAGIGAVAACSGLLYGYIGWGGVKEAVAAALIALLAALAPGALDVPAGRGQAVAAVRGLVPLALTCAAVLGALSIGGGLWIVAVLALAFAVAVRRLGPLIAFGTALAIAAIAAAGSLVALGGTGFSAALTTKPTVPGEILGNLIEPLKPAQVLGIWPAGDFRLHPSATGATTVLLLVLGACAITGIIVAARAGAWPILAYGLGVLGVAGFTYATSWAWIDAKAFAVASPAPVLLALVGIASLEREFGRAIPLMLTLLVAGGVLWTDVRAYHDANLTPHARHHELADIASRFHAERPALMTEYDPWGARWFLRGMQGEGASELRYRVVPLLDGSQTPKTTTADIDQYQLGGLVVYKALVLRRSPVASRPPSMFRLAWTGRYYEVWLRRDGAPGVLEHLGLSGPAGTGGVATCRDTLRLAQLASPGGHLLAAPARSASMAGLDGAARPASWPAAAGVAGALLPFGAGTATVTIDVPREQRYDVWLGGAVKSRTTVSVDGVRTASLRSDLQYSGQWLPAGTRALSAGVHRIDVHSDGGDLAPGSGGAPYAMGPVALSPAAPRPALISVPPARAGTLCHRTLDWIEAVRG